MNVSVRLEPLAVPEPNSVPLFSPRVIVQETEVTASPEISHVPNEKPVTFPPATKESLTTKPKLMVQASVVPLIGPLSYVQFCANAGIAPSARQRITNEAIRSSKDRTLLRFSSRTSLQAHC